MKHPEIVNAVCFIHNKKTVLFVLIIYILKYTRIISNIGLIPGSSREWTMLGDMLQESICGNNAAIETKQIREDVMEYFMNKRGIS